MRKRRLLWMAVSSIVFAAVGVSQSPDPTGWQSKLTFHAQTAYGPLALSEAVVTSSYLQVTNAPREWGQGGAGFGKRLGSTLAYSGVRNLLAFGLDTTLHQDPRYYRSSDAGFWHRTGHVFRGTILTHKDSGGETLATWRLGSAYGVTFLSNYWYPDRLNTVKLGLTQGTTQIGFDFLSNLASEFWPDVKKKILHRKPTLRVAN